MQEKTYPWWSPVMGAREKELLSQVIDSGFPNDGPFTEKFENELAAFLGAKYAVAVTSCTAGLYLSLMALGIGSGDEVLVPDITFIATANAVSMTGAKAVLVDVNKADFCIDFAAMRKALSSKTRAIIPVHVSGRAPDMERLLAFAQEHNLKVIEDAAEALGSKTLGKYLGTLGLSGAFSFSPAKTITTGQGGLIVTNSEEIHGRLRELKDQGRPKRGTGGNDTHVSLGFNFKFTDLQAAMGLAQLETLSERLKKLQKHYECYKAALADNGRVRLPEFDTAAGACPQWIDAYVEEDRDGLYEYLKQRNADCRKFWFPLHTQNPYLSDDADYKNSIDVSKKSLWLPSSLNLEEADIYKVAEFVNDWAKLPSARTAAGAR
ncbi:MAG: DegT/DnrJ/EryC1/StrS family aminotransferase [Candidatus Obscuribacterales bacterium]|nr:DegT/DnrJ/EryC1/StrS family aminotransferase [Candidatus Obscuribacterales bacterium]